MTKPLTYLAYATTGREAEVEAELQARGFKVWCGRKVEFVRKGKRRRAEAVISPKLPNYLFITMTADEWHRLHSRPLKYLAKTSYVLRRDDEEDFAKFRALVDMDHQEGLRVAERNNAAEMVQFKEGQALVDLRGRFGEQALRFRGIVERVHDFPVIEAETEMMGRIVSVHLDPLDVKGADTL